MSNIITVVGALASTNGVTIFKEDGSSEIYGTDRWETSRLLEAVLLPLAREKRVTIDLDQFTVAQQLKAIMPEISMEKTDAGEKLVVREVDKRIEVPQPQRLTKHIEQAVFGNGAGGFRRFLSSFGAIDHKHSADELLSFMERGDLPICNDGQLLVYKSLNSIGNDVFADTHTGKVHQKLGSRVSMPVGKVDDDRRNQCATGLHVCSKHYGTYGGFTFLAKVPASDVIAVPSHESGKVRCASYHLVYLLPPHLAKMLNDRRSIMEDPEGRALVLKIINGDHVGVLEEVVVGGSTYLNEKTPVTTTQIAKPVEPERPATKMHLVETAPSLDPRHIRKQIDAAMTGDYGAAITRGVQDSVKPPPMEQKPRKAAASDVPSPIFVTQQEPVRAAEPGSDPAPSKASKKPKVKKSKAKKKPAKKTTKPAVMVIKQPSPAPAPLQASMDKREIEYQAKFAKAKAMLANGGSLRQVAKELGMCRESLSKRLKAEQG